MGQPLTEEQLWGVPEEQIKKVEAPKDFCPRKNIRCQAWDDGCQAEICIQENDY